MSRTPRRLVVLSALVVGMAVAAQAEAPACPDALACIDEALGRPLCGSETVPRKLEKFVGKKLSNSSHLLEKAGTLTNFNKAIRLVQRARMQVEAVGRKADGFAEKPRTPISPACHDGITGVVNQTLFAFDEGRLGIALPTCSSYCDLGDGTVVDSNGLQWEKKNKGRDGVDHSNLHDVNNFHSWAGCCSADGGFPTDGSCDDPERWCQPNAAAEATCLALVGFGTKGCNQCATGTCAIPDSSTTLWHWINQVNAEGYAGHTDWRIPTTAELESILLEPYPCTERSPCIDPVFGPTIARDYWSLFSSSPGIPGLIVFGNGVVLAPFEGSGLALARAVRSGSPSGAFLDR